MTQYHLSCTLVQIIFEVNYQIFVIEDYRIKLFSFVFSEHSMVVGGRQLIIWMVSQVNLTSLIHNMFVIPIPFSKEHKSMLSHCKQLMEYDSGRVAINPRHTKLITALRTAVADEWSLDKEATSHNDLLDAFRMSLQFWH